MKSVTRGCLLQVPDITFVMDMGMAITWSWTWAWTLHGHGHYMVMDKGMEIGTDLILLTSCIRIALYLTLWPYVYGMYCRAVNYYNFFI